jgi:hypothetical protein
VLELRQFCNLTAKCGFLDIMKEIKKDRAIIYTILLPENGL